MSRFDAMYPKCGGGCDQCGLNCKRAIAIDADYASRLAFMLECMVVDGNGHWDAACRLLDEYKAEWEKVNPSPPTLMGEPMPPERREQLANAMANRAETSGSPCTGDVRADVRATPDVADATRDVAP